MAKSTSIKKPTTDAKQNGEFKRYLTELERSEREFERYISRCDKIVRRYRDEDRGKDFSETIPRFNILWSNTETLTPALYARTPKVQVDRRFKTSDPVARNACQIWERATQFAIDNYDFDSVMRAVVKDYQLAGRGTAWAKYSPAVVDDGIPYQEVLCEHVNYADFGHTPAKQWQNVRMVWRKVYLGRKKLVERFGKDIGKKIPLDYSAREDEDAETDEPKEAKQARIYEIWDSDSGKVIWLSKSYNEGVLDSIDDPLGLHDFFPTPRPLYATTTTDSLIPIPDYAQYQDQAKELDQITAKIALLEDALRLVGFYDATYAQNLTDLYNNPRTNEMIPIQNWQKLQAAGGMKGIAEWMEIGDIVEALTALYQVRDRVKQDLYEITGIADIIRGATSPAGITATEQRIKGQFATLRLSDRQRDVERYARDLIALQGELIAEHFQPEILAAMTGAELSTPQAQQEFIASVQLLQNDPMRSFRVNLETDSMIAVDDQYEKQQTTEFIQTFGQVLQGAMAVVGQAPVLAPMLGETLLFAVRRFRAGRQLETSIEQGMQGLAAMAQQAMTQPKQDPEVMKVQARAQLEQQEAQNKIALQQNESANKLALDRDEMQQRLQLEREKFMQEMALEREKFQQEMELERARVIGEITVARQKAEQDIDLRRTEMDRSDALETKKAILGAKLKDIHVLRDGSFTTKPIIKKTVKFSFDPVTKERVGTVVEQAVGDVDADESTPVVKSAKVSTDPMTGEKQVSGLEVPISQ